jgi:hypothetical protein
VPAQLPDDQPPQDPKLRPFADPVVGLRRLSFVNAFKTGFSTWSNLNKDQ